MTEEQKTPETTEEPESKPEAQEPFLKFASEKEHDEYLERMLKERLERKDRKLAEEKAETERLAREAALKEQEDWKKLAEEHAETISQRNARIDELGAVETERDALKERVGALEERLKGVMAPRLESVPELFRPFVQSMTVEEQAKWLEDNEDKMTTVERPRGSRPTGPAARKTGDDERGKEAREAQRSVSRI